MLDKKVGHYDTRAGSNVRPGGFDIQRTDGEKRMDLVGGQVWIEGLQQRANRRSVRRGSRSSEEGKEAGNRCRNAIRGSHIIFGAHLTTGSQEVARCDWGAIGIEKYMARTIRTEILDRVGVAQNYAGSLGGGFAVQTQGLTVNNSVFANNAVVQGGSPALGGAISVVTLDGVADVIGRKFVHMGESAVVNFLR